jgi:hypothetical protein
MKTLICTTPGSFAYEQADKPVLKADHASALAFAEPIFMLSGAHNLFLAIREF